MISMNVNNDQVHVLSENPEGTTPPKQFWGMNLNTYCMLMNLIQILPGWGAIIAILMWILNKDNSPEIDRYGKNVTNWIISFAIFAVVMSVVSGIFGMVGLVLTFVTTAPLFLLGHFSMGITCLVVMVVGLVFPIIAAVKANDGILWKYPFSYTFFK